jgi:hypothetical protein
MSKKKGAAKIQEDQITKKVKLDEKKVKKVV